MEGTVSTDVFDVELPTIPEDGDTTFNFILDPEGLIAATGAARYNNATFEEGTLFFANVGENGTTYSNTSDALSITNYSSMAVDVAISATITGADGITLTDDSSFADDTSASVYLAVTDGTNTVAIMESGALVSAQMDAAGEDAYKMQWTEDEGYKYALVEDPDEDLFSVYSFQLTGASNSEGDWSELAEIAPSVEVVWNVAPHSDAYVSSTVVSTTSNEVTLTLPEDVEISSIVITKTTGALVNCVEGTHYTLDGNTLTFSTVTLGNNVGGTIELTYSDGHSDILTVK